MGERGNGKGKGKGRAESGTKLNSGKFSTSIARFASDTRYEQKSARLGTFFFGAYSIPFINLSSLALPPAKRRSLTSLLG